MQTLILGYSSKSDVCVSELKQHVVIFIVLILLLNSVSLVSFASCCGGILILTTILLSVHSCGLSAMLVLALKKAYFGLYSDLMCFFKVQVTLHFSSPSQGLELEAHDNISSYSVLWV